MDQWLQLQVGKEWGLLEFRSFANTKTGVRGIPLLWREKDVVVGIGRVRLYVV